MILAIGKKYHLPERESEDLMQEVAAVCHQQLQTFIYEPEHCRFRSFLFKVAENLSRNLLRKCKPAPPAELKTIQPDTVPGLDKADCRGSLKGISAERVEKGKFWPKNSKARLILPPPGVKTPGQVIIHELALIKLDQKG